MNDTKNDDKITLSLEKLREILTIEKIKLLTKTDSSSSIESLDISFSENMPNTEKNQNSKEPRRKSKNVTIKKIENEKTVESQNSASEEMVIHTNTISTNKNMVLISYERLKSLEMLEKKLPEMIKLAIDENKKNNLKRLHEKDKLDPKSVNARVKKYVMKHKDKINAKRREKRKEEKLLLIQQKALFQEENNEKDKDKDKESLSQVSKNTFHDMNDVGDYSDSEKSITVRFDD